MERKKNLSLKFYIENIKLIKNLYSIRICKRKS